MRRMLLAIAAGLALLLALYDPSRTASYYVLREILRGAQAAGLMDTGRGLGGQVMGFNYCRHPAWVHQVAGAGAWAIAFAPALVGSLIVLRRISRERWIARPRVDLVRFGAAALIFGIVAHLFESTYQYDLRDLTVRLGERAGMTTYYISVLVIGENGPFHGDGLATTVWNKVWAYAPGVSAMLAGAAAAVCLFAATGGLARRHAKGACAGCGYPLGALDRCPECGRDSAAAQPPAPGA
jgi:hypothetical protein